MNVLYFNLSGRSAHFKRPDVNVKTYFTYNHIPKVALLGLLGAVLGLGGYNEQAINESKYPEFYEKLKNIKLAVVPKGRTGGIFRKKTQVFNNSVGYASKEQGNNLIIYEQWLENPEWDIYISLDENIDPNIAEKLTTFIIKGEGVFQPYLGKNDHIASLSKGELRTARIIKDPTHINSIYYYDVFKFDEDAPKGEQVFTFKDNIPVGLNEVGMHVFKKIGYTNRFLENHLDSVYDCCGVSLAFI